MGNIWMNGQEWDCYDPVQWAAVASNRHLLFRRIGAALELEEPEWMDQQREERFRQLEFTMGQDRVVATMMEVSMMNHAIKLINGGK